MLTVRKAPSDLDIDMAQHESGSIWRAGLAVIGLALADLMKSKAVIERQSGMITGFDFEKQRFGPLGRQ